MNLLQIELDKENMKMKHMKEHKTSKTAKKHRGLSGQPNLCVQTQEIISADFSETHKKDAPILKKSSILYKHHMIMKLTHKIN